VPAEDRVRTDHLTGLHGQRSNTSHGHHHVIHAGFLLHGLYPHHRAPYHPVLATGWREILDDRVSTEPTHHIPAALHLWSSGGPHSHAIDGGWEFWGNEREVLG